MYGVSNWDELDPEVQNRIQSIVDGQFSGGGGMASGDNSAQQMSSGDLARDMAVAACKAACTAAQAAAMEECAALLGVPPPFGEVAVAACEAAALYAGSQCRDACDNM